MLIQVIGADDQIKYIDPFAVQLVYREGIKTIIVLDGCEVVTKEDLEEVAGRVNAGRR